MRWVAFATVALASVSVVACGSADSKYDPNAVAHPGGTSPSGGGSSGGAALATQRGVITDFGTGKPVAGATVKANDAVATTDSKGAYELKVHEGEPFSMEVTAPDYVKLVEQQTSLTADYDRGETTIVPMSMSALLHQTLTGYDASLGVLSVAVLPTGSCASADGATLKVADATGAKVKYMVSKMPSSTLSAVKNGEFPSAVIYNLPTNVPITVSVESTACRLAAFPFTSGGITYEATVTTQQGDVTSFQRLFLKGNSE